MHQLTFTAGRFRHRDGLPVRQFHDLERRATDLSARLAMPCLVAPSGTFLGMVH